MSTVDEIVARLKRGEAPGEILSSLQPARHRAALKACTAVRTFDRELFEGLLAPAVDGAADFDDVVHLPEVEAVPRAGECYRVRQGVRPDYWTAWWRDEPGCPETELPAALRALVDRLVAHYLSTDEPTELLFQLSIASATARYRRLFREADEQFDLAKCHDLIEMLSDTDRTPLLGPELTALRDDRAAYLAARSLWSTEYLQTGTFLEPDGARPAYEQLIAGDGPRILQLHAPGGRGKTMELRWLISRQLVPERPDPGGPFGTGRIPCAKIDFDVVDPVNATTTPWLVLLAVAAQLNQQLPMAPFTELLQAHAWATPLLRRHVTDAARVADASKRLANEKAALKKRIPHRFAQILVEATSSPVVVVFDTLEEVHLRPLGDLQALLGLLTELLTECPTLRLILAGRYEVRRILGPAADALPAMAERELRPFARPAALRYLESLRKIGRPEVCEAIVTKVGGDPFKLALLADIAQQRPGIDSAEIEQYEADLIYLVDRIIRRIDDPEVCWILRYGVVPRTLTVEFVHEVMQPFLRDGMAGRRTYDSPENDKMPTEVAGGPTRFRTDLLADPDADLDLGAVWSRLLRYAGQTSWVWVDSDEPDTVRFHVAVVEPMRRVLRDHPVYRRLHESAVAYFTDRVREGDELADRWLCESIYHRFQLDGPGAASYWREAVDSVEIGDPERRQLLASELLGPDYLDADGRPHPWRGDEPIVQPETVLEARFERACALAQMARRTGVGPDHQLWSGVRENLAAVERANQQQVVPEWRLAYLRAALALEAGFPETAERYLLEALPLADRVPDEVRLLMLLAEIQLAEGDRAALSTLQSAIDGARALPAGHRSEPLLRRRVAAAYAELDRLDEAERELRTALESGTAEPELQTSLHLIGADVALRSGRISVSAGHAASAREHAAGRGTDQHLAAAAAMRAALARGDSRRALDLAELETSATSRAFGTSSGSGPAVRLELAGVAAGELMEFDRSIRLLENARSHWFSAGDLESVARCYTRSALVQLRGVGNLVVAEQHLYEAETLELPVGSAGWLRRAAVRAELLDRQGRRAEAARQVRTTLDALREPWTPPRRLVRAAVDGLAVGDPEQHADLLGMIIERVRAVTPAAARIVLLSGLARVAELSGRASVAMRELRLLLLEPNRLPPTPDDRVSLMLNVAEVERLSGAIEQADERLREMSGLLGRSGVLRRRWYQALDRLGTPAEPPTDQVLDEFDGFPTLCAAFLIERAEVGAADAPQSVASLLPLAAERLAAAPDTETQWHARLRRLEGESARRRGAPEQVWMAPLSAASAAFAALGDPAQFAVIPRRARDRGLSALEQSRVKVGLSLDGNDLVATAEGHPDPPRVARHPLDGVRDLVGDPDAAGRDRSFSELARRYCDDWIGTGRDLGRLLPAGWSHDTGPDLRDLRLDIEDKQLGAIPWELARDPKTSHLLVEGFNVMYRAVSRDVAARDEVRFVQAGLNRVHGDGLVVDGDLGPRTAEAVVGYQRDRGLFADGLVRQEFVDRVQADLAVGSQRPLVLLAQPATGRQVKGTRGSASTGVHLERLYERHGFDVVLAQDPDPVMLASAILGAGRPPAVVHLAGSVRETSGGIGFTFLAGDWNPQAWDLSVTALHQVLDPVKHGRLRPIVVLDVDRPAGTTDAIVRLLQRNAFATELFALGGYAAVLATGLVRGDAVSFYDQLTGTLGADLSVGATAGAIRRMNRRWVDLGQVLPAAGLALFTHLPWLRPRALTGGFDAAR